VPSGMRSIEPIDSIRTEAVEYAHGTVRWLRGPAAISGALSLVLVTCITLEPVEAQNTKPTPEGTIVGQGSPTLASTPSPAKSAKSEKTEKGEETAPVQTIKVQTSPKVTEVLNSLPLVIKDEDTQLIRLKKMRFNMALTEAKDRYSLYKKGLIKLYDLIDVGQRVLAAQADLAQSPEERADVLQKQLEIFAEAEDNLQKQIKEGKAESADLDHLRYERLGVEIDLEILRRGMAE
jgi:hypothetical protein